MYVQSANIDNVGAIKESAGVNQKISKHFFNNLSCYFRVDVYKFESETLGCAMNIDTTLIERTATAQGRVIDVMKLELVMKNK